MKLFLARNRFFRSVTAVKNGYCWVKTLSAAKSPNYSRLQSSTDINDGALAACAAPRPLATSPAISSFRHSALLILKLFYSAALSASQLDFVLDEFPFQHEVNVNVPVLLKTPRIKSVTSRRFSYVCSVESCVYQNPGLELLGWDSP